MIFCRNMPSDTSIPVKESSFISDFSFFKPYKNIKEAGKMVGYSLGIPPVFLLLSAATAIIASIFLPVFIISLPVLLNACIFASHGVKKSLQETTVLLGKLALLATVVSVICAALVVPSMLIIPLIACSRAGVTVAQAFSCAFDDQVSDAMTIC